MNLKTFYKRLAKDLYENTHPDHREIIKNLKITSLEQTLGIFRSVMIRNTSQIEDAKAMKKELKALAHVIGLEDRE